MTANWKLFYQQNESGEVQFAELLTRDEESLLRKGGVFTHGTRSTVASFEAASDRLINEGYLLQREWTFDRNARNYSLFADEIKAVIEDAPGFSSSNALAIITDSSCMTVGFALRRFDEIDSANDGKLWIVDEWGDWSEDWRLDPAYRWLLAYGDHDALATQANREFSEGIRKTFQGLLASYRDTKDILLIYVGGDDVGHRWSAELMDQKLASRMLGWVLGA
ncbi:hypothetical protein Pla123a_01440 [Posidoniimonas polymericola]|uniref:Uncharacterized protein n=1 Tax=Posidoniimonas polymericola TaxID=2528002 RepID=A0A5C5ZE37_9BACT|nr:hypothetical protein [Posidoniimonas polymericola]TWT85337.1 hypothetical protein Pla123a_01440 [Posidoniimonas polymericola]